MSDFLFQLNFQLESDFKTILSERDTLDNHVTSLTLQKDAFEDEVSHVRLEMSELRVQLDNVYDDNALLNKSKSELEVKVEMLEKETREVEEVLQLSLIHI